MRTMRILQARVKAIAEIVSELVAGIKEGRDVDLNNVKREVRIAECLSMTGKDKWTDKTALWYGVTAGLPQVLPSKGSKAGGCYCCSP